MRNRQPAQLRVTHYGLRITHYGMYTLKKKQEITKMVLEANKKFELPLTEGAPVKSHVKDLSLAPRGRSASSGPRPRMPVLRPIRERFAKREAAEGHAHVGLPARDDRDGQPDAHTLQGRRRGPGAVRLQSALHAGRRGRRRWSRTTASPPTPSRARTTRPTTSTSYAALDHQPAHHHGRRRRPGSSMSSSP